MTPRVPERAASVCCERRSVPRGSDVERTTCSSSKTVTSVEPPPMSAVTVRPSRKRMRWSDVRTRRASSSPSITSRSMPADFAARTTALPLSASRVALVATARCASTPWSSITSRKWAKESAASSRVAQRSCRSRRPRRRGGPARDGRRPRGAGRADGADDAEAHGVGADVDRCQVSGGHVVMVLFAWGGSDRAV